MKYKTQVKRDLAEEKAKLDKKIMKLNNFIRGVDFMNLTTRHRDMLEHQSIAMTNYSQILRDRIIDITSQEKD